VQKIRLTSYANGPCKDLVNFFGPLLGGTPLGDFEGFGVELDGVVCQAVFLPVVVRQMEKG